MSDDVGLTASVDVLTSIAKGTGPRKSMLALGYAGWAPGQLESEIQAKGTDRKLRILKWTSH